MPVYEIADPTTGRTIEIEGDSPPTEAELNQIFGAISQQGKADGISQPSGIVGDVVEPQGGAGPVETDSRGQEIALGAEGDPEELARMRAEALTGRRRAALGGLETLGTIGSSVIAEPLAGIAGIAQGLNPFADKGASARAVEGVRESLTFQPRTEAGKESLAGFGEALAPVAETIEGAETGLGRGVLSITGSPALAAVAHSIPTAIMEAVGGGAALRSVSKAGRVRGANIPSATEKQVSKAIVEAAPDIDVIKDASRAVYKEIDDVGVMVKPEAVNSMLKTAIRKAKNENVDDILTPKSSRVVDQFARELEGKSLRNVTDLDQLRKKAQIAAAAIDPSDARVGLAMIDEIDSFMDNIPARAFVGDGAKASQVGKKYKAARKLWGRARRAELIGDAMDKAGRQASGFENGIRVQLRQILNNKKRSRFFSKDELAAMDDVVKGSNEQNILKLVGRLGFSEGQATNVLGGLAGSAVLGPVTPIVGQISRGMAQRSTKRAAELSDALVKAGPNGKKITEAYLRTTKPKNRSSAELSRLFLDSGADIDTLIGSSNKLVSEAAEVAKGRKAILSGVAATGAETQQAQGQE